MKPLKARIDKRLIKINANDLKIFDKQLTDDVKFLNKGLANSVMFRNVSATNADRKDLIDHLEADKTIDFTRMPFDDIFFAMTLELRDDDDSPKNATFIEDGVLLRITKSRKLIDIYFITSYIYSSKSDRYITTNFNMINVVDNNIMVAGASKQWLDNYQTDDKMSANDKRGVTVIKETIHALSILKNILKFEQVKTEGVMTSSEKRHVPTGLKDKFIEYTLDLSKPNRKRFYQSKPHQGGSHESPCEHTRRGHMRTYKSGKQVWVKGMVVNKGSKTGKVEKDYAL